MNYSNYRITLDVRKTVSNVQLTAKKGDAGRRIYVTLSDKGNPCEIADGLYAVFAGVKPDGTLLYNKTTIENNTIIYEMTQQTTAVPGLVECEVKLFDSMSNLLTSPKLTILVDDVVVPDEEIASKDEVTALAELILDATVSRELATAAANAANEAATHAQTATEAANSATANANQAAESANTAASNAQTGANSATQAAAAANQAAESANQEAANANTAAQNANEAAEETLAAKEAFLNEASNTLQTIHDIANDCASAIECEASGEVITLKDSGNSLLRGLNIYGKTTQFTTTGKNLLNFEECLKTWNSLYTKNGEKYTITDIWAGYSQPVRLFEERKTVSIQGVLTNVTATGGRVGFGYIGTDGTFNEIAIITDTSAKVENVSINAVRLNYGSKGSFSVENLQIEAGEVATAYEPYTGGIPSPNPDYPQELESVGGDGNIGVTVVGKNLFGGDALADKMAESAGVKKNETDGTVVYTGKIISGNTLFTNFKPKTQYTFILKGKATDKHLNIRFEYENGETISAWKFSEADTIETFRFVSEPSKTIAKFHGVYNAGTTTLYYDECGVFEGNVLTADFEPYIKEQTLTAQTPNGLPSIGDVRDEIDFAKGVYVQRVGEVDMGTLNWTHQSLSNNRHMFFTESIADIVPCKDVTVPVNALCERYRANKQEAIWSHGDMAYHSKGLKTFDVVNNNYTKAEDFKSAMSGIVLLYELAEPIETPLSPEELAQYSALHTNKPNTTVFNDSGAGMAMAYNVDTKTYIDNKFNELALAILNNA